MRTMVVATALLVGGCWGGSDRIQTAEQAVAQFHRQLSAGQVAAIRAGAAPGRPISSEEAAGTLEALRLRLGQMVSSMRTGMKADPSPQAPQIVTLTYDTRFANGRASETFAYNVASGKAVLASYSVSATDTAVTDFHRRLDAGQIDAIVATAGGAMKGDEARLRAILAQVRERMGTVKSSRCTSFNARMEGAARRVELTYDTQFAKSRAAEEFVILIQPNGTVELAGYLVTPLAN